MFNYTSEADKAWWFGQYRGPARRFHCRVVARVTLFGRHATSKAAEHVEPQSELYEGHGGSTQRQHTVTLTIPFNQDIVE
ncbi:MAG: hypothetical protein ACLR4Z_13830 [Butyricicoccaceae bacterium]